MIVSKNCYLTQMPFKIDRNGTIVSVTTLAFTGDLEVSLQRFQWISELSPWRPLRFSVWWFDNLYFNSCSLKCLQNALLTWILLKWTKTPIFTISRKIVNTSVIRMLFEGYNIKQIYSFPICVFYCRHGISYSYNSFCRHIGADFNGWWETGCCCVKK